MTEFIQCFIFKTEFVIIFLQSISKHSILKISGPCYKKIFTTGTNWFSVSTFLWDCVDCAVHSYVVSSAEHSGSHSSLHRIELEFMWEGMLNILTSNY